MWGFHYNLGFPIKKVVKFRVSKGNFGVSNRDFGKFGVSNRTFGKFRVCTNDLGFPIKIRVSMVNLGFQGKNWGLKSRFLEI